METLRYPKGRFTAPESFSSEDVVGWIDAIEALPGQLRSAAEGLSDAQLDTAYRPEGWTVRQVIHHVPDSHLNAYVRTKWTLTEENPEIKVYDQDSWSRLPDSAGPIEPSLELLEAVHQRWVSLLRELDDDAFRRTLRHPEMGDLDLGTMLALYAWHGAHHLAHVEQTAEREGW